MEPIIRVAGLNKHFGDVKAGYEKLIVSRQYVPVLKDKLGL